MALVLADRVRDTTTTTGTGTVTLSGTAPVTYQTFGTAIGNGNTTYYTIAGDTEWEVGIGTYSSTGPTLARTTVLSSSAGGTTPATFSAGTKSVFVTYPAEIAVGTDISQTITNKTISGSSNTITNVSLTTGVTGTLPVANGGTGITSFGTGVATFLGTPSSANLAAAVTDETGSGSLVFGTTPTFTTNITAPLVIGGTAVSSSLTLQSTSGVGSSDFVAFKTGSQVERMRISSAGLVGIGTNSPQTALHISFADQSTARIRIQNTGASGGNFDIIGGIAAASNVGLSFYDVTNSATRMYIDSSGNVGIGTTAPVGQLTLVGAGQTTASFSTTGSMGGAVFLGDTGVSAGNGGAIVFSAASTAWRFAAIKGFVTNGASNTQGDIVFSIRPNATNAALTEAMRITSAGYVGIGISTPTAPLQLYAGGAPAASGNMTTGAVVGAGAGSFALNIGSDQTAGYNWINSAYINSSNTASPLVFMNGTTEAMRITAAGYVNVSSRLYLNSGATQYLSADGSSLYLRGGPFLIQNTAGTTTYINGDASGRIGIGTTTQTYQLQLSTDSAAKPSTNTWTIASDARIKTETGEYTKGLDAVCALRPITYEYNGNAGFAADGKENISIIAQEAIVPFPECVGMFKAKLNPDDEEETELFDWNGHALTFALVNAVKELKAQNDALAARIAVFEAR